MPRRRSAIARTASCERASPCFLASKTTKSFPRPCIFRNAVMAAYIGGAGLKGQRPIDREGRGFLNPRVEAENSIDMRAGQWIAVIVTLLGLAIRATGGASVNDPYVWLEEVHG